MDLRIVCVLAVLVFGIGLATAAGPAPTTLPSGKPMVLEDSNGKSVSRPTAEQIKAAVAKLDGDRVVFLILRMDETHFIQVNWDAKDQFSFQYAAGNDDRIFETTRKYPADVAVRVLLSYLSGTEEWKKGVEWGLMK